MIIQLYLQQPMIEFFTQISIMHYIDDKLQFIVIPIGEKSQQLNVTTYSVLLCMISFWDRMSDGK